MNFIKSEKQQKLALTHEELAGVSSELMQQEGNNWRVVDQDILLYPLIAICHGDNIYCVSYTKEAGDLLVLECASAPNHYHDLSSVKLWCPLSEKTEVKSADHEVTHWAPLPDKPKVVNEDV